MNRRTEIDFTTGQVAEICSVAPRTVTKWFDSGRIMGYRVPNSKDRRIPRKDLVRFLKKHGMPLGNLENEMWYKILIIGADELFTNRFCELFSGQENFNCQLANNSFDAGIQFERFHSDVIIIDMAPGRSEALQLAKNLRGKNKNIKIIALTNEDETATKDMTNAGFDNCFKKPFDIMLLYEHILAFVKG